jgi:hypothetical protein
MKYSLSIILLVLFYSSSRLSAQSSGTMTSFGSYSTSFFLTARDTVYQLPKEYVVEGSEQVLVDSTEHLRLLRDYRINYRYGQILISSSQRKRIVSDTIPHTMTVRYRALPFSFKHEYALRHIDTSGLRRRNQNDYLTVIRRAPD